jgi:hypothetical protein
MTISTANTALPAPPKEYSLDYMNRLIKQLNLALTKITAVGPIVCGSDLTSLSGYPISGLTIVNVPTSPTGLPVGSIWCDTASSNVLKIVT